MASKLIYFVVDGIEEQCEFRSDDNTEDLRETFRSAAEAGPNDILKLYNKKGNLVNISPKLPENTHDARYKLEVVAAHCNGQPIADLLGFDSGSIDHRLHYLERLVYSDYELPSIVHEIKYKVEEFREKLQGVEHLSWLGLFKDISCGTSLQPFWDKKMSLRRTGEQNRRVLEKFMKMCQVQVTDEVRMYLRKPTFDNWQWDEPEMLILLRQMYIDLGFLSKFNIEIPVLNQWLYEVFKNYNQVPFHNFKHCFMVTQMMYGLTWLIGLPKLLDDIDVFTLITSTICHDLDHPGYNNAYQINAKTELAMRYNDISPLENHHCSVAFAILEKMHCNFMRNMPKDQFKRVREGIIRCILATDMAKHNEIVNSFKSCTPNFDFDNKDHRSVLMMILMKVSDISNEARPMDVAVPWLDCLLQEFFNQLMVILVKIADILNEARPADVAEAWLNCLLKDFFKQSDVEKLEGLPVAPFMDREKVTKSSSQIGFIKFVLLPLFEALGQLCPVIEEIDRKLVEKTWPGRMLQQYINQQKHATEGHSDDIIGPVRKALDYYTEMQRALEEEKKRKNSAELAKQNGILCTNQCKG